MSLEMEQSPGLFAEACVKLEAHTGAVRDLTDEIRQARRPSVPQQPSFGRIRASAIADANGFAVLRFDQGGPAQGFFWYVRTIVVGGLSPAVAAPGVADVYVVAGQTPEIAGSLAALGLSDWRDRASTLPLIAFYSLGEMALRLNERLFLVVTGGTADQQYVAAASIEEYQESAARQMWAM